MAIELASIIPQDDEYSPQLRKSSRGMRATKRGNSNMMGGDVMMYLNTLTAGNYGFFTGAFVILFLLLWVFLYSFNFNFIQHNKDSKCEGEADPLKVFFWALFISVLLVILAMFWMNM